MGRGELDRIPQRRRVDFDAPTHVDDVGAIRDRIADGLCQGKYIGLPQIIERPYWHDRGLWRRHGDEASRERSVAVTRIRRAQELDDRVRQ